ARSPGTTGRAASSPYGCTSSARPPSSSPAATATTPSTTCSTVIRIPRYRSNATTHGAGCTHSATLAALLARGEPLADAARGAAAAASRAVRQGLPDVGAGDGPVDILGVNSR